MLEIRTENGVSLDLLPDTQIDIELTNPMFNEVGSHSMNFELPPTPKNLRELGFPENIHSLNILNSVRVSIYFLGHMIMQPNLFVKTFEHTIIGYLAENEGDFYQKVKNKFIGSFDYGVENFTTANYQALLESSIQGSYPAHKFVVFPVKNEKFYNPSTDADLHQNHYRHNGSYGYFYCVGNKLITPFPYLAFVIDTIFNQSGYAVKESLFNRDTELRKLVIFNTKATQRYGGYGYPHSYIHDLGYHLPEMSVSDFMKNLLNYFNCTVFVNNSDGTARILSNDSIIANQELIDISQKVSKTKKIESNAVDGYRITFNPDRDDDYYNEQIKDVNDPNFVLKDSVPGLVALVAITTDPVNTIRYVESERKFYVYRFNAGLNSLQWEFYSLESRSYTEGSEEKQYESEITTLFTQSSSDLQGAFYGENRSWEVPILKQAGNDPYVNSSLFGNDFTLRLLFYRGIVNDTNGNGYPLGHYNYKNINGNVFPGATKSLLWDGQGGLFESFWKKWLYWITNEHKKVTFYLTVNIEDLITLDFSKKYRAYDSNMILSRVSLSLTPFKISLGKVEAFTV